MWARAGRRRSRRPPCAPGGGASPAAMAEARRRTRGHSSAPASSCHGTTPRLTSPPVRRLADRLAVTKALTAVAPDHPELVAARSHGIATTNVQQLIADAAATHGQMLIGLAGTHGKSTTTGWVVQMLVEGGLDPSAFVGALMPVELVGGSDPRRCASVGAAISWWRPMSTQATSTHIAPPSGASPMPTGIIPTSSRIVPPWSRRSRPGCVASTGEGSPRFRGECRRRRRARGARRPARLAGAARVVRVTEDPEDPEAVRSSLLDAHVTGAGSPRAIVARWRHGAGEGSLEILGLEPGPR